MWQNPDQYFARCYKADCYDAAGVTNIHVTVNGVTATCSFSGQVLNYWVFNMHGGKLTCPDIQRFCDNDPVFNVKCPNNCGKNGFCVNGVCKCTDYALYTNPQCDP